MSVFISSIVFKSSTNSSFFSGNDLFSMISIGKTPSNFCPADILPSILIVFTLLKSRLSPDFLCASVMLPLSVSYLISTPVKSPLKISRLELISLIVDTLPSVPDGITMSTLISLSTFEPFSIFAQKQRLLYISISRISAKFFIVLLLLSSSLTDISDIALDPYSASPLRLLSALTLNDVFTPLSLLS